MLRFGATKITEEKFYAAKESIRVRDVNFDNVVISKIN